MFGRPSALVVGRFDLRRVRGGAESIPGRWPYSDSPDGRTYAMVANDGFTSNVNDSARRSTPTGMLFLGCDRSGLASTGGRRQERRGRIRVLGPTSGILPFCTRPAGVSMQWLPVARTRLSWMSPTRPGRLLAARIQDGEGGFDALNSGLRHGRRSGRRAAAHIWRWLATRASRWWM